MLARLSSAYNNISAFWTVSLKTLVDLLGSLSFLRAVSASPVQIREHTLYKLGMCCNSENYTRFTEDINRLTVILTFSFHM